MKHVLCALGLLVSPAAAQSNAVVLFIDGGRTTGLVGVSATGDEITGGFTLGGGLGLQFGSSTALRIGARHVRTSYSGSTLTLNDTGIGRTYIGTDLQAGWPGTGALVPYMFVGGGLVRTTPDDTSQPATTDVAGRLGAGFNWLGSLLVVFGEVDAWIYRFSGLGFRRIQFDVETRVGLAVPFAF